MKQLSQNMRSGKLSVDEVPMPGIQAGYVLVRTAYSLISAGTERTKIETGRKSLIGKALSRPDQVKQVIASFKQAGFATTYQKVKTRLEARSPMGYSASGIVLAVGEGVKDLKAGDWVSCSGASAAHAEVMAVPKNLCVKVPQGVNLETAAFATVGAIAMQGIRLAEVRLGEVVTVVGLGLLGQLTVQLLKAAGAVVFGFEPNPSRCEVARQAGADVVESSEGMIKNRLLSETHAQGADVVIITAGTASNRPVEFAGEICRNKGRVVVVGAVGLSLPREPYYNKEISFSISRSYGPGRYDPNYEEKGLDYPYGYVRFTEQRNVETFLKLAAGGKINVAPLITHQFFIDDAVKAYDLISGKTGEPNMGVLFKYNPETNISDNSIQLNIKTSSPLTSKLGIGFIGAGNFAQSMLLPHLKNNPQASLVGITTLAPLESRDVADRFGFEKAVSGPVDLLDDEDIQAVVIATRHGSHANLAIQAINKGKKVHVEKPLAMNREELNEILKTYSMAQRTNPFLMVGFNRRFAPMVLDLVRWFEKSSEPFALNYRINAGYLPLDHWTQDPEQGGGRIVGEVCHFLDLLQFISGSTICRVYASGLPNQGKYNDDNVSINVQLKNGSIGSVLYIANGDKSVPKEYLEVFGAGKAAVLNDYQSLTLFKDGKKILSRQGAQDKGHKHEMEAWVDAIRSGKSEPVPFAESVIATLASFAAIESLHSQEPVEVG